MTTLFIATLRTPNFTFEAAAKARDQLEPALEAAWQRHADEHASMRHEMLSFESVLEATEHPGSGYELEVRELVAGTVYRDGVPLVSTDGLPV